MLFYIVHRLLLVMLFLVTEVTVFVDRLMAGIELELEHLIAYSV